MENKVIPTAKELIETDYYHLHLDTDSICLGSIETAMIEFAKLHVEKALKEASEKAETDYTHEGFGGEFEDQPIYEYFVKKDSILNSYPLEKIK
jgi:hypothetical protein